MKYCRKHRTYYFIECQECVIVENDTHRDDIPPMLAKYDGWCAWCDGRIRAKLTYISRIEGEWVCQDCVDEEPPA